jgi:ribosomal protein S18 acetylase RimI-like enzyme
MALTVRDATDADREWVVRAMEGQWGSTRIVSRGRLVDVLDLPTLVCREGDERLGLAVWQVHDGDCEVVAFHSPVPRRGAGSALLHAVAERGREAGCPRMWLITTNDNLAALRFYQRWGMRLVAVHRNAMDETRRLKPEVPEIGLDGIPLRDEIELELRLDD